MYNEKYKECSVEGCDNKIEDHYWGHVKAHPDWFFMKDGTNYCPDHIPDWVEAWRASNA